jgi:hypothetical protein
LKKNNRKVKYISFFKRKKKRQWIINLLFFIKKNPCLSFLINMCTIVFFFAFFYSFFFVNS